MRGQECSLKSPTLGCISIPSNQSIVTFSVLLHSVKVSTKSRVEEPEDQGSAQHTYSWQTRSFVPRRSVLCHAEECGRFGFLLPARRRRGSDARQMMHSSSASHVLGVVCVLKRFGLASEWVAYADIFIETMILFDLISFFIHLLSVLCCVLHSYDESFLILYNRNVFLFTMTNFFRIN